MIGRTIAPVGVAAALLLAALSGSLGAEPVAWAQAPPPASPRAAAPLAARPADRDRWPPCPRATDDGPLPDRANADGRPGDRFAIAQRPADDGPRTDLLAADRGVARDRFAYHDPPTDLSASRRW